MDCTQGEFGHHGDSVRRLRTQSEKLLSSDFTRFVNPTEISSRFQNTVSALALDPKQSRACQLFEQIPKVWKSDEYQTKAPTNTLSKVLVGNNLGFETK
jgi:hypothetical protein